VVHLVASRHEAGPFALRKNPTTNHTNYTNKNASSSHAVRCFSPMQNSDGHATQGRPKMAPIRTIAFLFVGFVRFVVNLLSILDTIQPNSRGTV
jgi:hypothetical protein